MIFLEYRIDSGLIVNAIVYNGVDDYTPAPGLAIVERGDSEAWMAWTYDQENRTFTPPPEEEV